MIHLIDDSFGYGFLFDDLLSYVAYHICFVYVSSLSGDVDGFLILNGTLNDVSTFFYHAYRVGIENENVNVIGISLHSRCGNDAAVADSGMGICLMYGRLLVPE